MYQQSFVFGSSLFRSKSGTCYFTFETVSVKKELELSRKRTQKMRTSEAQKYQLVEFLIVVLTLVGNVDKAQDIT